MSSESFRQLAMFVSLAAAAAMVVLGTIEHAQLAVLAAIFLKIKD